MPTVKATFTADISQFRQSLAQATTAVTAFDRSTSQVNRDLARFGNQFSGATIQRQAETLARSIADIGGAAKLSDAELRRASSTVTEALQKYQRLGQEAPASIKALSNELKALAADTGNVTQQVGGLGQVFGPLKGLAAGAIAGLSFSALASGLREIVATGQQVSALGNAFVALQGSAGRAADTLRNLRDATRGLVSDVALFEAANKAQLLGLTALGVDMADLAKVATTLGRAMGQDAAKSIDDLTIALGRVSPQILDNLGISVKVEEANAKYAASVGKTVTELTEQEKKLAFIQAAMEAARAKAASLGDVQLTLSDQAERASVAFTNLQGTVGAWVNDAGIASTLVGAFADAIEGLSSSLERLGPAVSDALGPLGRVTSGMGEALNASKQFAYGLQFIVAPGVSAVSLVLSGLTKQLDRLSTARQWLTGELGEVDLPAPRAGDIALTDRTMGQNARANAILDAEIATRRKKYMEEQDKALAKLEESLTKTGAAAAKLGEKLDKLVGRDLIANATKLAEQITKVGITNVLPRSLPTFVEQLQAGLERARELGPSFAKSAREIEAALNKAVNTPAYRELFRQSLRNPVIGLGERSNLAAITGRDLERAIDPLPDMMLPDGFDTFRATGMMRSIAGFVPDLQRGVKATKDWRVELQGVAQAFAQLSQVAGPAMDGVSRVIGVGINAGHAMRELLDSLGASLKQLGAQFSESRVGQMIGGGLSGGIAGFQLGMNADSMGSAVTQGVIAGGMSGMAFGPVGMGVGAVVGGVSAYFGQRRAEEELRRLKDIQAQQLVSDFGSLDALLDVVGRLGMSQETFLERFYGEPQEFAAAVSELNAALTQERREVDALTKSLNAAARAQGILSRADMERLRNLRPGGPGDEVRQQFLEGQTGQLVTGLTSLLRSGPLSPEAVGSIGVSLGAAFTLMKQQGLSVKQILDALSPALDLFRERAVNAGLGSTEQFDNLARMLDTLRGPMGSVIDGALGAGQALAALTNTGMINQDMFGGLTRAITDAYKTLELNGRGGVDAVLLLQGPLQNIWQLMEDFGLQVDSDTQSLIDFALQAGLIGEDFRPATEQMVDALDKLIERMDALLSLFAEMSGVEFPDVPDGPDPGAPGAPVPDPRDVVPFANGGIVTRPTRALIGEAGPEAVIPLSKLRQSGQRAITIVNVTQLDGREVARSVNRYQGDERRLVGVA